MLVRRLRAGLVLLSLGMMVATVAAQTPRAPAIEVASVKPSGNSAPTLLIEPGGRFVSNHTPIRVLLSIAFGPPGFALRADQIVGAPDWVTTAPFDITLKAENPADLPERYVPRSSELGLFLRELFADRFKLQAHMEKRDRPVYALVVKNGTRLGKDLHPSSVDCANVTCGTTLSRECPRPNCIKETGVTMDTFAFDINRLGAGLDRLVVNQTGLEGRFDLLVRWVGQPSAAARAAGVAAIAPSDEYPFLSAIQDHLGLKLEPKTVPLDTLVIDHIERPTED